MSFQTRLVPFAFAAVSLFCIPVFADGNPKSSNVGEATAPTASSTAVDHWETAMALVRYGDSKQDALAMIAAARIMKEVGDSPSKAAVVKGSGQTTSADKKTDTLTVEAILARAKQYAGDRKDLVALAEDAARVGGRGAVHGPGRKSTLVYRGTQDVYQVAFRGGEPAIVFAAGDGDSDLDLYVYDENENLICSDTDLTDRMLCRWSPRWTGQFTIKVKNLGMANYYTIVHN